MRGAKRAIRQRVARAIHRIDFWSIRSPVAREQAAPGLRSSHELRWLPRDEVRSEIALVVPTHTSVHNFSNSLLEWRRNQSEQFRVEGGNAHLPALVDRAFLHRRHDDPSLRAFAGSLDDLDDLFRAVVWHLMVDGKTYLIALWHDAKDLLPPAKLPGFRIVEPSALKRRRANGRAYVARLRKWWPGAETEDITVDEADVVEFHWPLPGVRSGGISPVDRVVRHHLRWYELMDALLAATRSQVEMEDKSLRTERARWKPVSQINNEFSEIRLKIAAELFDVVSDQPMTRFFDAYQVLKFYHRQAIVREYLLSRFNHFVERFSAIAQPGAEPARLALIDYPAAAEIERVMERYATREIAAKEAIEASRPKK